MPDNLEGLHYFQMWEKFDTPLLRGGYIKAHFNGKGPDINECLICGDKSIYWITIIHFSAWHPEILALLALME